MEIKFKIRKNAGAVGILITVIILFSSLTLILSFSYLLYLSKVSVKINIDSIKSFYIAESGLEDVLLRFKNDWNVPSSYILTIDDGTTSVSVGPTIGGVRLIISNGNKNQKFRKISLNYLTDPNQVSFYYGAQVGAGGMKMGNNSYIFGNVFSNGSILPRQNGNQAIITGTAKVASSTNSLDSVIVLENAYASWLKNCEIFLKGYYTPSGGVSNCWALLGFEKLSSEIEPQNLPIPQSSIDKWKEDALIGGEINGDYNISGKITVSLGPKKINGNLTVDNNATLNMTGTIWVTGNVTLSNGSKIKLDYGAYGNQSGILLSDGKIKIRPNTKVNGSGQSGSYLMLLSTNNSLSESEPAIDVDNNSTAALFYTQNGLIYLHNGIYARSVTGYAINLDNNASIWYESGLEDTDFKSGPSGGGWSVNSWNEIE